MNINTAMNQMPKSLLNELKSTQLYEECFTDTTIRTVRGTHTNLVPDGIRNMITARQEVLLAILKGFESDRSTQDMLHEIEVLRLFLTMMTETS